MQNEYSQSQQSQSEYEFSTQKQISQAYRQIEDEIKKKFLQLTTDTMEEVRNNLKRKNHLVSSEENKNLISQEREKIIAEMQAHKSSCLHPQCREVNQIVLLHGFSKGLELKDIVTYICRMDVPGLGYELSACYFATQLNNKMNETHRLMKGL